MRTSYHTIDFSYDETVDNGYLRFSHNKVARTVEYNDFLVMDYDENGNIVGVEILGVSVYLQEKRKMRKLTERRVERVKYKLMKDILEHKYTVHQSSV